MQKRMEFKREYGFFRISSTIVITIIAIQLGVSAGYEDEYEARFSSVATISHCYLKSLN